MTRKPVKKWKKPKVYWRVYCKGIDNYDLKEADIIEWYDDITEEEMSDPDCGLDFHACYNWIYGEGEWETIKEERIEFWSCIDMLDKGISRPRWKGFHKFK